MSGGEGGQAAMEVAAPEPVAAPGAASAGEAGGQPHPPTARQRKRKRTKTKAASAERKRRRLPGCTVEWRQETVKLSQSRQLALSLFGADTKPDKKIVRVQSEKRLTRCQYIFVEGVDRESYSAHKDRLSVLCDGFTKSPLRLPGDAHFLSPLPHSFFHMRMGRSGKEKLKAQLEDSAAKQGPSTPEQYLMSPKQQAANEYPAALEDGSLPLGYFRLTKATEEAGGGTPPLFGVDCEMVITSNGRELARVSIVDREGNAVYDALVQPAAPVIDYVTRYSGIDAAALEGVEVTLQDVQADIQQLLPADCVLVGHSFENDLLALKLIHARVMDTALLFDSARGKPFKPSLKNLAQKFLGEAVQQGTDGHCSLEDARVALRLALLKIEKGPVFGISLSTSTESIFERLERAGRSAAILGTRKVVVTHGALGDVHAITCVDDAETARHLSSNAAVRAASFVWASLNALRSGPSDRTEEEWAEGMEATNTALGHVLANVPDGTLAQVVLVPPRQRVHELYKRQKQSEENRKAFVEAVTEARQGLLFTRVFDTIKPPPTDTGQPAEAASTEAVAGEGGP